MADSPRFSVIIPTCNREQLLFDCVDSVYANTFDDFEIVVVDQGKDGQLQRKLRERYDSNKLKYFHVEFQHASGARNKGLEEALGEVLVFLDDDAVAEPGLLQAYEDALKVAPERVGAFAGRLVPRWGAPKPDWMPDSKVASLGMYDRGDQPILMPESDLLVGANFAILRGAAEKTGPFDLKLGPSQERPNGMLSGEDSLYSIRIVQSGHQIQYVPKALARHYVGARKLRVSYFLRRYYWEGYTYICVLFMAGSITRDDAGSIVRFHLRNSGLELFKILVRRTADCPRIPSAAKIMECLAESVKSLGMVMAANRLRRIGQCP